MWLGWVSKKLGCRSFAPQHPRDLYKRGALAEIFSGLLRNASDRLALLIANNQHVLRHRASSDLRDSPAKRIKAELSEVAV